MGRWILLGVIAVVGATAMSCDNGSGGEGSGGEGSGGGGTGAGTPLSDNCADYPNWEAVPCKPGLLCYFVTHSECIPVPFRCSTDGEWFDASTGECTLTTPPPEPCDDIGVCDDQAASQTCLNCAVNNDCWNEFNLCAASESCINVDNCVSLCADQVCIDACLAQYPDGAALYEDVTYCVYCAQCPVSCSEHSSWCP